MKKILILYFVVLLIGCNRNDKIDKELYEENLNSVYKIVIKTPEKEPMCEDDSLEIPGEINLNTINKLNEPLRGMAALYAGLIGTNCNDTSCDLTIALGLGNQGSDKHINLINKYFPDDSLAKFLIKQNCTLGKSGSSFFSEIVYLTLFDFKDTIKVEYESYYYSRDSEEGISKITDVYLFKNNVFKEINRDDTWIIK